MKLFTVFFSSLIVIFTVGQKAFDKRQGTAHAQTSVTAPFDQASVSYAANDTQRAHRQSFRGMGRLFGKIPWDKILGKISKIRWDKLAKSVRTAIKKTVATRIKGKVADKGSNKLDKALNKIGACSEHGRRVKVADSKVIMLLDVFPGPLPCYSCKCSMRGQMTECRRCLATESIEAGEKDRLEECYREAGGWDYRGLRSFTKSGRICQAWSSQEPHQHANHLPADQDLRKAEIYQEYYTPAEDAWAGLENRFCRNPSLADAPWCYTMDKSKTWEYCDVPKCKDDDKRWRSDGRCGPKFVKNGKPAECDPDGESFCCNQPLGVCGNSKADCGCKDCIDYQFERALDSAIFVINEAALDDPI